MIRRPAPWTWLAACCRYYKLSCFTANDTLRSERAPTWLNKNKKFSFTFRLPREALSVEWNECSQTFGVFVRLYWRYLPHRRRSVTLNMLFMPSELGALLFLMVSLLRFRWTVPTNHKSTTHSGTPTVNECFCEEAVSSILRWMSVSISSQACHIVLLSFSSKFQLYWFLECALVAPGAVLENDF